MPMSYELNVQCCFCGKVIEEKPRVITVDTEGGGEQRMFAHTACLRERLDPSVPLGRPGAFGIDVQHNVSRWTMRRVIGVGLAFVLLLLIPAVVVMFVWR